MDLDDEERRRLADLERHLEAGDPGLARRMASFPVGRTVAGGVGWRALAGSLFMLLAASELFLIGLRSGSLVLLVVSLVLFPMVMVPVRRSMGRRRP